MVAYIFQNSLSVQLKWVCFIICKLSLNKVKIFILFYYVITVVPIFLLLLPSTQHHPRSVRQSPHRCPRPQVMHMYSLDTLIPMLYFTSPWLLCDYQFVVLNPFTSLIHSPTPFPSDNHQNVLCIYDCVSVLLVCLLDSIVNRYVFVTILLFIFLIFFLLTEDPLTFHIMLVWWQYSPLVFSCLGSSLSVLQL